MVVRKPLRESTDLNNDSVLDGDGADVKTGVLDEDDSLADINGDEEDALNEAGGEDTGEEVDNIGDEDLDSLLNESDDEDDEDDEKDDKKLDEANPIDNLGDKKAPPFNAEDAKEARGKKEKKEAEEDDKDDKDGKKDDGKGSEDGKKDKDGKDGEKDDDDKDLKEDFDDPAEVIEPTLYTDVDDPIVEEFGEIPDVVPEYPDEPIVELEGDEDVAGEVDIDSGVTAPSYDVDSSFVLPESRNVVVAKGDRIYFCGKAKKDLPSFAETTFAKAAKMLAKNKKLKGAFITEGRKKERVAVIGRSCLVEVARDWRLPGTDTIFEKGDIIQIVSRKQITEKEVKVK